MYATYLANIVYVCVGQLIANIFVPVKVTDACDYYDNIDYCQNDGDCITVADVPQCRYIT